MLTKGKSYKKNYHSKQHLLLSRIILFTPLLLISLTCFIWSNFKSDLTIKKKFHNSSKLNLDQLSQNISYAPSVWHQWYFLGLRTLQSDPEDYLRMDFAEKCFQKASHYAPINKDSWYMLFMLRDQLGLDKSAQEAYLFYFKLLNHGERKQHQSEAMDVLQLNYEQYEKIKHLEHAPIDFEIENVRKI